MLLIYSALAMGGIETFYIRLAAARASKGLITKLLLTSPVGQSDAALLKEMSKHAAIHFLEDYQFLPSFLFRLMPPHLLLALPVKTKEIGSLFCDVSQVHVSSSMFGFFYLHLDSKLKLRIPLTIGVYHSREFIWDDGKELPKYEIQNRALFFESIPKSNVIFFNDRLLGVYEKYAKQKMAEASVFPLGVVSLKKVISSTARANDRLSIGSVGRLVQFKSYNIWMLDVVKILKDDGYNISYRIYGDGPLYQAMQKKIVELGIGEQVSLQGTLAYAEFDDTVSEFDIFVGSGTAIIEAAKLGVPSIVGIESNYEPTTYGFLSDIPGFSYNENGLYPKVDVCSKIISFIGMPLAEKNILRKKHIDKAEIFSMDKCVSNFEGVQALPLDMSMTRKYGTLQFRLCYSLGYLGYSVVCRLSGKQLSRVAYG